MCSFCRTICGVAFFIIMASWSMSPWSMPAIWSRSLKSLECGLLVSAASTLVVPLGFAASSLLLWLSGLAVSADCVWPLVTELGVPLPCLSLALVQCGLSGWSDCAKAVPAQSSAARKIERKKALMFVPPVRSAEKLATDRTNRTLPALLYLHADRPCD